MGSTTSTGQAPWFLCAYKREIKFDIPSYFNGTLRVMAVSASIEAAGAFKSDILVQSDIIITPNLPLFVAPDDEFTVPVTYLII